MVVVGDMDEYDAPAKISVQKSDELASLEEIEQQTCRLFEEFLILDDSGCKMLDAPLPASHNQLDEQADLPIAQFSYKKSLVQSRGLLGCHGEREESIEDDVVPDMGPPAPAAANSLSTGQEKEKKSTDNNMSELAVELARAGDALVNQYGSKVQNAEGKLLQLITQEATDLTYDRFCTAVEDLVGKDKDWTHFVFAFCIGRRVLKHSKEALTYSRDHFQRYVKSYSQTMLKSGGMENFVKSGGQVMNQ